MGSGGSIEGLRVTLGCCTCTEVSLGNALISEPSPIPASIEDMLRSKLEVTLIGLNDDETA